MATFLPVLLIAGLLQSAPPESSSIASRAEQLKQKRVEKQAELTPFKPSKMERRLVNFEKTGFKESLGMRFGDVYADIGGITTGAGFATTLRYFQANLGDTPLDVSASVGYSIKGYGLYGFQFGNIMRKSPELFLRYSGSGGHSLFSSTRETEGNFYLYGEVLYRYFPQEDFYGLGNESLEENKTDYRLNGMSYDAISGLRLSDSFGAFIKAGYLQANVSPGSDDANPGTHEVFDETTAPGLNQQPDFVRLSSSIYMDYRDVFGNPKRGGMYTFSYARFIDVGEGDYSFRRFSYDLRQYMPLFSEQRILAVRLYSSFDDAKGDSAVPFYLMQTLGGSDSVRGYSEFRFRDRNLFFLSTEYRWIPHPVLHLVFFYDTGKVFPEIDDFDFEDMKRGYGIGARLMSTKGTILRFDVGHSEEGTHLYFKFNASF